MCDTCQPGLSTSATRCNCGPATKPVDWSKPVMLKSDPNAQIRVICTDRDDPAGGRSVVFLESRPGMVELTKTCRPDGSPYGLVNRPEYRYKNVYADSFDTSATYSSLEACTEKVAKRGSKLCVIQFVPGDNSSAKIIHTY